jgi:hypothetical protein
MKSAIVGLLLLTVLAIGAQPLRAEFYQWVDSRGIIHFTDGYDRVPQELRGSSRLIVRADLPAEAPESVASGGIKTGDETEKREQTSEPRDATPPAQAVPETGPVSIHYNPQEVTIIVVQQPVVVRRPRIIPGPPPRIDPAKLSANRQYIHPSVFSGGSREFIHPSTFQFQDSGPKISPQKK